MRDSFALAETGTIDQSRTTIGKVHGRIEVRACTTFTGPATIRWLDPYGAWPGPASVMRRRSRRATTSPACRKCEDHRAGGTESLGDRKPGPLRARCAVPRGDEPVPDQAQCGEPRAAAQTAVEPDQTRAHQNDRREGQPSHGRLGRWLPVPRAGGQIRCDHPADAPATVLDSDCKATKFRVVARASGTCSAKCGRSSRITSGCAGK